VLVDSRFQCNNVTIVTFHRKYSDLLNFGLLSKFHLTKKIANVWPFQNTWAIVDLFTASDFDARNVLASINGVLLVRYLWISILTNDA